MYELIERTKINDLKQFILYDYWKIKTKIFVSV